MRLNLYFLLMKTVTKQTEVLNTMSALNLAQATTIFIVSTETPVNKASIETYLKLITQSLINLIMDVVVDDLNLVVIQIVEDVVVVAVSNVK